MITNNKVASFILGTFILLALTSLGFFIKQSVISLKEYERFNDRSFEGTFEISITSDKQIKIEHSDMSIWADEDNHDGFAMASFR